MPPFLADVTLGQVAVSVAFAAVVVGGALKVWPSIARLKDLSDDWNGEKARPGHDARPGVIESIASLAKSQEVQAAAMTSLAAKVGEMDAKVTSIDYHSKPNGGGSAYDELMRQVVGVGADVATVRTELATHVKQAADIHDEQAAAIAFLASNREAVDDLADAIGPALRATPHECDLPHEAGLADDSVCP